MNRVKPTFDTLNKRSKALEKEKNVVVMRELKLMSKVKGLRAELQAKRKACVQILRCAVKATKTSNCYGERLMD